MVSPIRLEFPNALYHVMSRGNGGEDILVEDRQVFLDLLAVTPKANLSQIMRGLNGRYTRFFNKTRRPMGQIFQGRCKAIVVQKDSYLLELSRYIILNPVRAGMADVPENYSWSRYCTLIGQCACPDWLSADNLLKEIIQEANRQNCFQGR